MHESFENVAIFMVALRRDREWEREIVCENERKARLAENHSCSHSRFPLWVCVTVCVCLCRCVLILKTKQRLPSDDIHEMTSRFTNLAHPTNFLFTLCNFL